MQGFKNSQPQDVEEILASIRSSIAEESSSVAPREPLASAKSAPTRDEHTEFELPAMFKQQSLAQALGELRPRSRPLPRLRDELAQAVAKPADAPNAFTGNVTDISVARRGEPAPRPAAANIGTLRMGHHFDARPAAAPEAVPITLVAAPAGDQPQPFPAEPAVPSPDGDANVPRQMTSFKDSRMNRMSGMSRPLSAPAPLAPVPAPAPAPVAQPPAAAPRASLPPPVPETGASGTEDVAAQLLRPMLKAWLTENMPKIVEKALRSEADDGF